MLDETTIRRYLKEFKTSGVDGLLEDHYSGSESFLYKRELKTRLTDSFQVIPA